MIEAVSFDFFNTLVRPAAGTGRGKQLMEYLKSQGLESDPWDHQVFYDVLEPHAREYDPDLPPADKQRYYCRVAERVFGRLNVRANGHTPADHAFPIWEIVGPRSLVVFPEVMGTLERLRAAGYRLTVISNWQCGLGHFCTELGLARMFEHIVASAEVGSAKPSREIFAEACRRLGVAPDRVLHVGDTPSEDIDGARAAGMRAVLISRMPEAVQDGSTIRSLEELLDLVGTA